MIKDKSSLPQLHVPGGSLWLYPTSDHKPHWSAVPSSDTFPTHPCPFQQEQSTAYHQPETTAIFGGHTQEARDSDST